MRTNEVRTAALEETKIGGDTSKGIALALIYIGDALRDLADSNNGPDELADAVRQVGVDIASEMAANR